MADTKKKKKRNFFLRHWLFSIILIFIGIKIFGSGPDSDEDHIKVDNNQLMYDYIEINSAPYSCQTYGKTRADQIIFCEPTKEVTEGNTLESFFWMTKEKMTVFFFKKNEDEKFFVDTYVYNRQFLFDGNFSENKNKIPERELKTFQEFMKTHKSEWKEGIRFEYTDNY